MTRCRAALVALALTGIIWPGSVGAGAGKISGKITPPGRVKSIVALKRFPGSMKGIPQPKKFPAKFDRQTGQYEITGLPDDDYDLRVDTGDMLLEGVNLRIRGDATNACYDIACGDPEATEITAKNFDLSAYVEPDEVVSEEKRLKLIKSKLRAAALMEKVASVLKVDRFMNNNRPLYMHGNREKAMVLVELIRDRAFYASKGGEGIWRMEIWPYTWQSGGWYKPRKGVRVLYRVRTGQEQFNKIARVFDPRIGGLQIRNGGNLDSISYEIPKEWDPKMGKVPK